MDLYKTIKYLYPEARVGIDFVLRDDADGRGGAYIDKWYLSEPKPTVETLQAAWEVVSSIPDIHPETPEQKIAQLEAELAAARAETLTALEAVAELYEMLTGGAEQA